MNIGYIQEYFIPASLWTAIKIFKLQDINNYQIDSRIFIIYQQPRCGQPCQQMRYSNYKK